MRPAALLLVGFFALSLAACDEEKVAELPPPVKITRDATGYYCSMTVIDHKGPKGQIILQGRDEPVWFTSVRDTIAFTMLPEEPKDIAAIYVTDMARAAEWDHPEKDGPWVEARTAWYVIGSDRRGGMGAPEAVPFGTKDAADSFAATHGGQVYAFTDIPHDAILGTTGDEPAAPSDTPMSMNHDEEDTQ